MELISCLLLISLLHSSRSECVLDHRTLSQLYEKQLHKDLRCDYHWNETPNNNSVTEVKIRFLMKYFELDSESDVFSMYSWTTLTWVDERLRWNASEYGGLTRTTFWSYNFWAPSLELNNKVEDEFGSSFYGQCKVENDGYVVCVPRILDVTQCVTKMADWPYDRQRCTLKYGINKVQKNVRLISRGARAVSMIGAEYGSEWTIVDYEQRDNVSESDQLEVTFILERNGEGLGAIIIFPSVLLSILTAAAILLDVNNCNRLVMVTFSIISHLFYLSAIGVEIPKHSFDSPSILLFFRFSAILNMYLLVMTVILGKLRNRESIPPPFVSSFTNLVLESHGKYFIWPLWDTNIALSTSESVNVKDVEVWNSFSNIINSLCLFVTIIVYSIMMPLYIPRQPPFN